MYLPIITEFERLFALVSEQEKKNNPALKAKEAEIKKLLLRLKEVTSPPHKKINLNKSLLLLTTVLFTLTPELSFASVESTLQTFQTRIIGTILPLAAILGILCATISFFWGSPNAKQHVMLAIVGAIIGFGAPSIIVFIRQMVQ